VSEFDYVIENDDFELSLRKLEAIVAAERAGVGRLAGLDETVAALRADIDELLGPTSKE
jgi:hypothetical protein